MKASVPELPDAPLLTPKHKKSRLQYAKNHVDNPQRFWDTFLWSDETKLELFGPMAQRYVWRRKNEAYKEKNTLPTVKHGGQAGCKTGSNQLIFNNASPYQYPTTTLLASDSKWSSVPVTDPATSPSIWSVKGHSHFISP
ncbi:hypothetical protein NFI96_004828 [Prochilodus magdalenae]|nr:hypothetical protein NFI96_004828 [Prochilodus magdalenae]